MGEFNFSKVLGACSYYDELNSKTLEYRINGFIYACNFNLDSDKCDKKRFLLDNMYYNGLVFNPEEDEECDFVIKRKYDVKNGDYFYMVGHSKDLNFVFNNYYGKKHIDNRVLDIPFDITLDKQFNDIVYQIIIETNSGINTKFIIIKENSEKLCFYANILDFSKVLNIVKSFVINPEIVYTTYNEIKNNKRIDFSNTELNEVINKDEKLEKPAGKFVKKLKMIANNDWQLIVKQV